MVSGSKHSVKTFGERVPVSYTHLDVYKRQKHYHIRKREHGILIIIGLTLRIFLASNKKRTFNSLDGKMKSFSILKRFWRGKRYEN